MSTSSENKQEVSSEVLNVYANAQAKIQDAIMRLMEELGEEEDCAIIAQSSCVSSLVISYRALAAAHPLNVAEETFIDDEREEIGGFAIVAKPNDIDKIEFLTNCCRLRLSELMGRICTDPNAVGNEHNTPIYACMTGREFQLKVEKETMVFVYIQLDRHPEVFPEVFDVPGYRSVLDVLVSCLNKVYDYFNEAVRKDQVIPVLMQAIEVGNKYLTENGAAINQQIDYDWVIEQPII